MSRSAPTLTDDEVRWIVEACREYAALLVIWRGKVGDQPVLMPGWVFQWWADTARLRD
jgi:hypothetical protein